MSSSCERRLEWGRQWRKQLAITAVEAHPTHRRPSSVWIVAVRDYTELCGDYTEVVEEVADEWRQLVPCGVLQAQLHTVDASRIDAVPAVPLERRRNVAQDRQPRAVARRAEV